jgi:hypothetical protein
VPIELRSMPYMFRMTLRLLPPSYMPWHYLSSIYRTLNHSWWKQSKHRLKTIETSVENNQNILSRIAHILHLNQNREQFQRELVIPNQSVF